MATFCRCIYLRKVALANWVIPILNLTTLVLGINLSFQWHGNFRSQVIWDILFHFYLRSLILKRLRLDTGYNGIYECCFH